MGFSAINSSPEEQAVNNAVPTKPSINRYLFIESIFIVSLFVPLSGREGGVEKTPSSYRRLRKTIF